MNHALTIPVYLEIGQKRTFAGATAWPGWSRSGRDEESALQALLAYGSRYAHVLEAHGAGGLRSYLEVPSDIANFLVVERLAGNTTTDFGAPDAALAGDLLPMSASELERWQAVLAACWQAFGAAVRAAEGQELRKGPRGGGRDLDAVVQHVLDAQAGYLARLAWKAPQAAEMGAEERLAAGQAAAANAFAAAAHGLTPTRGPRGGVMWTPRAFVRRSAWHLLDHAWEIEDRSLPMTPGLL